MLYDQLVRPTDPVVDYLTKLVVYLRFIVQSWETFAMLTERFD